MRERLAQGQSLGDLGDHQVRHLCPELGGRSLFRRLHVRAEPSHGPQRLAEVGAQHADLGGCGRLVSQPHVAPGAILAAPERAELALVFAGAVSDEAEAVDSNLDRHDLSAFAAIPALDRVDLSRERVEARALALLDEQGQLVVGGAARDGAADEVDSFVVPHGCDGVGHAATSNARRVACQV